MLSQREQVTGGTVENLAVTLRTVSDQNPPPYWRSYVDVEIGVKKSAVKKKVIRVSFWNAGRILAKRAFSLTDPFVKEAYDFIFIHTAVLGLEHIHHSLVIPRQMFLE
jgi:hypothetical protein